MRGWAGVPPELVPSSRGTVVEVAKAALRLFGLPDVADAVADLTGIGSGASVRRLADEAARRLSVQAYEFVEVGAAGSEAATALVRELLLDQASAASVMVDRRRRFLGAAVEGGPALYRLLNRPRFHAASF